ncbi:MAG: fold metallo-hydrolase, partial [Candidatus Saccharibacteria bacterium]|nr:fold metallo-hydrolase [Candidatus Saccharibacteria bacterium]
VNGPWAKFSQTVDYMMELKPKVAFPTHDAFLSIDGDGLIDHMVGGFAAKVGTEYNRLAIGEPVEL